MSGRIRPVPQRHFCTRSSKSSMVHSSLKYWIIHVASSLTFVARYLENNYLCDSLEQFFFLSSTHDPWVMLFKLARFSYFILFTWSLVRILANIRTNPHIIVPWIFLKQYLQPVLLAGTQSQYHCTWSYSWTLHQKLEFHAFISKSSEFFSNLLSLLWFWKSNSLLGFTGNLALLFVFAFLGLFHSGRFESHDSTHTHFLPLFYSTHGFSKTRSRI